MNTTRRCDTVRRGFRSRRSDGQNEWGNPGDVRAIAQLYTPGSSTLSRWEKGVHAPYTLSSADSMRDVGYALISMGSPTFFSKSRKGSGSSSSTLTILPTSQAPSATSMAAATGGTPAV